MRIEMSEYEIPFHIQEEIMKRLPVKSLIQFRSVSKAWKSLIDSSEFIAAHSLHRHTQPQHLLVSYGYQEDYALFCRSYLDDDSFPQQSSLLTLPPSVKGSKFLFVIGSSHGLLCLHACDSLFTAKNKMVVLWNPSIRKSVVVDVPDYHSYGFGVCSVTGDPKIIGITQPFEHKNMETSYRCEVMVYTLSSGKWRTISTNPCTKPFQDSQCIVVTNRFIYWRVGLPSHKMLLSFDVTNESFEVIDLPDILACHDHGDLITSMVRDSLTMLEYKGNICTVWMMEHGVQKLFTKRFDIKATNNCIMAFTKKGIPIMLVMDSHPDNDDEKFIPKFVFCEPDSEHNSVLEICGSSNYFAVVSYTETLLLLGRSDCISY